VEHRPPYAVGLSCAQPATNWVESPVVAAAGGYSPAGFRTIQSYPKDLPLIPRHSQRAAKGVCMKNLPANLSKLLEWLDRVSPLPEAQIVAAGFNHTLDKALMQNFADMNLCEGTASITARGRAALSKFPGVRRGNARTSDNFLGYSQAVRNARSIT
jgi:hypothetical protein